MSKLPSIPSIPGNVDPQLYQVLSALKSNIDNLPTNTVTQTDLIKAVSSVPPGEVGPPGPNGDSYVLDITGGNTTIIYNEYGLSPLPHLVPFGYLFYKNGVSITTGLAFSWSITHPGNSLLSGISTSDTFIPAIAPTFDKTKADNSVFLVVTHLGMKFTAAEPISISAIGATGNNSASFSIDNAGSAFSKNAGGTISPSLGIALTTYTQNITSPTYQWQLNGVNIAGGTASSYTVPTSAYSAVITNTYKCTVTGIINGVSGSTLNDTITIPLLVDGTSAPTVILSNENMTFPGPVSGYTGITFTGGNCNITAYIGSVALSYGTTGALTFSCTNSSIGATVAGGIGSASTYAVLAPTAMSTDIATTDVVITIRDALGNALSSITKRISYSLSRLGSNGLNGSPGTNGNDGVSLYTWLKYADTTTTGMSDLPTGKTYMGVAYNKTSVTESTVYTDYAWSLIKGTDGIAGVDGTNTYTWVKYGTSATGTGISDSPTGMTYIGLAFNKTTATESVVTTDYAWSLIQGATGKSYLLFITGGITNTIYDTAGINPLPAQTAFSCELYEDGVLKTPATYAWSVPSTGSLLTGSSSTATFTPTLAATFDRTKSNNRVLLTVTYAGITVKAVQPIVMTQLVIDAVDMTAPSAISNLTVSGGVLYNFLGWGTLPGNFDHVEVWRSATNDRTVAALIGTSLFTVYADYIPDGVDTVYYYWIRAISKAGVAGAWNAAASAGISAAPLGIGDSQVSSISANKIDCLTLSAIKANLGDVTAGTLKSPDAMFIVDLVNKFIIVGNGTNNPGIVSPWYGSEYVDVRSGSLTTYQYNGSGYVPSKSLRVIETGVATNGTAVSLTKYYSSQPQIIVSPANLQVYSGANSTQNQTLLLTASAVTGSGSAWSFTPTATLQLSAALSGTTVATDTKTSTTDDAVLSTQQVTAANSTSINCSVTINSIKGTGAAPNWYNRQVSLRIGYRASSTTGNYTYGATTVVAMGSNTAPDNATISLTGLTAGTWYFVVEYTSANVAGNPTWSDGGEAYTLGPDVTRTATADGALATTGYSEGYFTIGVAGPTFPAYTPVSGYSIYSVDYTIAFGYFGVISGSAGFPVARIDWLPSGAASATSSTSVGTSNVPSAIATRSSTVTSYTTAPASGITCTSSGSSSWSMNGTYGKAQAKCFAAGSVAVIKSRKANTNTPAISNSFTLNNYYSNISGTAPLASGTLNWMAIL